MERRWRSTWRGAALVSAVVSGLALQGCTSAPISGAAPAPESAAPAIRFLWACHDYGCRKRTKVWLDDAASAQFVQIMGGAETASGERQRISRAVQLYEELSAKAIGIRDKPKGDFVPDGDPGQMDCVDESTNTDGLLRYLARRGLLKFHHVEPRTSRGLFVDGRYPHWTAVIRDPDGVKWAVDSWYEAAGGPPDIVKLDYWRTRGVLGER